MSNVLLIIKLKSKINTLELKNEDLKNTIKSKLYEDFMNKLDETDEIKRLRKENYKLRKKVKRLKQEKKWL